MTRLERRSLSIHRAKGRAVDRSNPINTGCANHRDRHPGIFVWQNNVICKNGRLEASPVIDGLKPNADYRDYPRGKTSIGRPEMAPSVNSAYGHGSPNRTGYYCAQADYATKREECKRNRAVRKMGPPASAESGIPVGERIT